MLSVFICITSLVAPIAIPVACYRYIRARHPYLPKSYFWFVSLITALSFICMLTVVMQITNTAIIASDDSSRQSHATEFENARVLRVVDGDTISVSFDDGSIEKVRLIGIDAPESVHPDANLNSRTGDDAASHLRTLLSDSSKVWMLKDVSDTDRYGRLLRYVWIVQPQGKDDVLAASSLNFAMVADGYADAVEYPPDTRFSKYLESAMKGDNDGQEIQR